MTSETIFEAANQSYSGPAAERHKRRREDNNNKKFKASEKLKQYSTENSPYLAFESASKNSVDER